MEWNEMDGTQKSTFDHYAAEQGRAEADQAEQEQTQTDAERSS